MTAAPVHCFICGDCWWTGCPNSADFTEHVALKRPRPDGPGWTVIFDGDVDLCAGHALHWRENGGRLNLKWEALEQATALQKAHA